MTYDEWIANVSNPLGRCKEVTLQMQEVFPELKRVRGHYYCWIWGRREHWWLRDPDGKPVDPTAAQFPSKGEGIYEEWVEGDPEPTGKCLNCGEYVYDDGNFCNDSCRRAFMLDLMGG